MKTILLGSLSNTHPHSGPQSIYSSFFLFAQHQYSQHFVMWWPNGHWNHVSTYIPSNNKITIMKKNENKTLFELLKWNLMFMDTLMAITTDAFALLPTECFIHQHWSKRLKKCSLSTNRTVAFIFLQSANWPINQLRLLCEMKQSTCKRCRHLRWQKLAANRFISGGQPIQMRLFA